MDFTFNEDQLMFHDSVKGFLTNEVTPEHIREQWTTKTGRSQALWNQLAELGLSAITVPEAFGGLGMNELDFLLIAEECGYAALPEPLVETVMVVVPLLASLGGEHHHFKEQWLPVIASGEARVAIQHPLNPLVSDAHIADLLLLHEAGQIHAVPAAEVELTENESVDPSRKLFSVKWQPSEATCIAAGEQAQQLWAEALNRGALAIAAQEQGIARRIVDISVDYTFERKQFGKPVGSFQAVKHSMANVAVQIEFARPVLYRAAYAVAHDLPDAARQVSHAKLATTEAALLAAKNGIQAHGAMGYTWEVDLQIFMKRVWALDSSYGSRSYHKQRIREQLLSDHVQTGAGHTFTASV